MRESQIRASRQYLPDGLLVELKFSEPDALMQPSNQCGGPLSAIAMIKLKFAAGQAEEDQATRRARVLARPCRVQ